MRLGRFFLCALATAALLCSELALAATKTWVGPFSGGNWSTGPNWSPSGVPVAGDTVVFNSTTISNADLGAVALGAIVFGPTFGGSVINGAVTINGLGATYNIDDQNTTATPNTINATIALTGTTAYFRAQSATRTLKLNGVISGNFGVRVYGPGSVDFSGQFDNTYTGATTVMPQGTLLLSGLGFKLVPADLFIGDGTGVANSAKVRLTSNFSDLIADTAKVTIASDGQLDMGIRSDTIAQLTGTGSVSMSSTNTLTVGDTGNFTWGGVISGTGNVNKVGTGTMTYAAANTYTGLTTVSNGTLVLNAGDTIQAIQGPLTIGDGIGAANTAIVQIANDYQINRNASGAPTIINSDGTFEMVSSRDDLGAVTLNGGNIVLGASSLTVFGGLSMNGGTVAGAGSGNLRMMSNVVATATGALGPATINSLVVLLSPTTSFTVNAGSAQPELTIGGTVRTDAVARNIIKTGSGTLRLAGTTANTYGGSTTIEQGVLELAKPDNVTAITGPIVIGNSTDPAGSATLKNLASNQLIGKPEVTLNFSGVYQVSNSALGVRTETVGKLRGSGKLFLPFRPELTIDFDSGFPAFFGPIDSPSPNGDGNKRINKRGGGTQIFNLNTTYDGSLVVYGGVLSVVGQMAQAPVYIDGGTLTGSGRVGDVEVGSNVAAISTLRPGGGAGPVFTTGATAFSFGPSARLHIDLPSATPGTQGKLSVTGAFRPGDNDGGSLYVNPTNNPVPANGTVFEIVSKISAGAVTGIFPGLPEGRSVYMGARNGKISYVGGDGNDVTLTVAPTFDIDGDSKYLAETDGLLIARYIRGLTGTALTQGAVAISGGARRANASEILDYLNHVSSVGNLFNVDQVGGVDNNDALLILRWMSGFRGEALVAGLTLPPGMNAEQFADSVRNRIEPYVP
ncbi:MAG: hypothetical protein EAZ21_02715 [Betaproteobacteria bacterium]|nr:MAG: hypothetical protein EAZ21_02715 [Betaproteobacteria bacterium]